MREIKFRGKRFDNGEWVEGDLVQKGNDGIRIVQFLDHVDGAEYSCKENSVIPETVGQFTGLKDKNEVEIYEGDVLQIETDKPMLIGWSNRFASFVLNRNGWAFSHWFGESCSPENCEIIGNIHDKPELLTKAK